MSTLKEIEFYKTQKTNEELVDAINNMLTGDTDEQDPIIFVDGDSEKNLYIGRDKVTDIYNSNADSSWKTSAIGGHSGGVSASIMKEKSISEILDEILYPTIQPTVSKYNYITLKYRGSKLIKVGTTLPSSSSVEVYIEDGKWSDGTTLPSSSSFDFEVYIGYGKWSDGTTYFGGHMPVQLNMTPNKFGKVSEEMVYNVTLYVEFTDGNLPKDNKGGVATVSASASDKIKTEKISVSAVYPVYVNTESIDEMTEQSLVDYNTTQQTLRVNIPEENENKFMLDLPVSITEFSVKKFNPLTSSYDIDTELIYDGEVQHDGVTYNHYIRTNDIDDVFGSTKYEIKIKK